MLQPNKRPSTMDTKGGSSRVIEEERGWPFSRWTKIEKEKSLVGNCGS